MKTITQRKIFQPKSNDGGFGLSEWHAYWGALTEAERQSVRDKAGQEHMTLSAVAMQWGAVVTP
jgi:hypothetical protein